MIRSLVAGSILVGLLPLAAPASSAAPALPIRAARLADDLPQGPSRWTQEWRVLAFHPGTRGFLAISLVGGPIPLITVQGREGGVHLSTGAELPYGLRPHRGPGVTVANLPDNGPPQDNSLSYAGGKWIVDLTWPVRGRLVITPQRIGVTVGPWRIGREPIVRGGPPTYVPGSLRWTVPVPAGVVSGWVEADGKRISLAGWRAYHDHTWGRFRRSSATWTHADFAVLSPRAGEAWIVYGLEPTDGRYHALPDDRRWQGVVVHATRLRVTTCRASVVRRGWEQRNLNLGGWAWDYWLPTFVRARCGAAGVSVRPEARPWPLFGGFSGGVLASSPLPAGNGWIEHALPVAPNS
jgi:hypothetical protein